MSDVTFDSLPGAVGKILDRLNTIEEKLNDVESLNQDEQKELFSEYVPKGEVRKMGIASSATLWNWEKQGKLKSYGVGGKRFYKRSELEQLIKPIKKGESHNEK